MKRPNILLVVMDAARADHLSCYGYQRATTPHLDRIASEGALYENAISAAVWTVPSHASLFTGMYPSGHGLEGRNLKLRDDIPTLAGFLHAQGYRTAAYTANALIGSATGLARGFEICHDIRNLVQAEAESGWQQPVNALYRRLYYGPRPHQGTWYDNGAWRINRDIKQQIQRWQKDAEPFFIFANYMETHLRYEPPRAFRHRFLTPSQQKRWQKINQNAWKFMSGDVVMTDDDWEILTALYDAELAYLDMRLGQLYTFLQERGLLDNTIIIITADHGENLGDHHLMDHQYCVYDTLARVPLIIRYPERFPAGMRLNELVQTVDLYPTLARLTTNHFPDALLRSVQGQSLLPETLAETARAFTVTEYLAPQLHSFGREGVAAGSYFTRKLRGLRTAQHKYIWASDGAHEFYDLAADPGEMRNVIEVERDAAATLACQLEQWVNEFVRVTLHEESLIDDLIVERLKALGYIEL